MGLASSPPAAAQLKALGACLRLAMTSHVGSAITGRMDRGYGSMISSIQSFTLFDIRIYSHGTPPLDENGMIRAHTQLHSHTLGIQVSI